MLNELVKHSDLDKTYNGFSILLPSWNNLEYLKICVESILKNSYFQHQIIIIVNEGNDGTLEWVKTQGLDFVYHPSNLGICYGLNVTRSLIKQTYVLYINDDMYVLPHWDKALMEEALQIGHAMFMLSGTMIEPFDSGNPCVHVKDFGKSPDSFKENELLKYNDTLSVNDWQGSTWPPNLMHIDLWDMIGGMSVEYSPGMYSDPDLSMKAWVAGVTIFKGLGNSLVYHFGSKSTGKVKKNNGKKTFLMKWQLPASYFINVILKRGKVTYAPIPAYKNSSQKLSFIQKLKLIKEVFKG